MCYVLLVVLFPDIETNFFPWLMAEVNNNLEKRYRARELLDSKKIHYHVFMVLIKAPLHLTSTLNVTPLETKNISEKHKKSYPEVKDYQF